MEIKKILQDKIFTVSEFNEFLNGILRPLDVVVEGEVAEWRVNQNKFIWFTLKDERETLQCFSMVYNIRQPVEEGMKVKISGHPRLYGKSGRFSFFAEKLELSGEGSLKRSLELLKIKLEKEGIFDPERKRSLPRFPKTVGLITARDSAAYSDFIRHLNARMGGLKIIFVPIAVQGEKTVAEASAAFNYFNSRKFKPDVVVLTRGGGSLEDLQYFNSEEVVRAVFSSKIPTICAIGHERDISLSELAADARASTPTHAAQLAVPDRRELESSLGNLVNLSFQAVGKNALLKNQRLRTLGLSFQEALRHRIDSIKSATAAFLQSFSRMRDNLNLLKSELESRRRLLASLAPQNVLSRGYSIVRKRGKIIKQARQTTLEDDLEVELSQGSVGVRVMTVHL